jgi:hypothetical protein
MAKREASALERKRYVLYARGHRPPDEHTRIHVVIFEDPAQAKTWLLKFLANLPHTKDGKFIQVDSLPMNVQSEQLEEILAAEDTSWRLPDHYNQWILQFKYGSWDEDHSKKDDTEEVTKDDGTTEIVKVPKPKREAKPKREGKPDNYVTIGELCDKWKIKPLHARTCLRASDMVKPEYGWAFDPKDVPKIAKICGVK